jgi:transcriptional regulator with XRE-family HTH domain
MPRPPKQEWPSSRYRASRSYQRVAEAFGARVRTLRLARKWTLENAAEAGDLDPTQLANIEAGSINVTLATIARIADGFGVPVLELFKQVRAPKR